MRAFLSGWQATNRDREMAVIKSGYLKSRCFSFAMVQRIKGLPYYVPGCEAALNACIENDIEIMMDSGVVSWRSYSVTCQRKNDQKSLTKLATEHEFIQQYVDYVKANSKKWLIWITIDLERVAKNIFERHKRIEAMGIKPVPVIHGDDDVGEYIRKYADLGHKLIAIASWKTLRNSRDEKKAYLDSVFQIANKAGVNLHGLAFTAPWQVFEYPFWSVDSSSWSRVAGFGGIMMWDGHRKRMNNINVSTNETTAENLHKLNPKFMQAVKEQVELEGFDFEQLRTDFVARHIYNARAMSQMVTEAEKKHGQNTGNWNLLF